MKNAELVYDRADIHAYMRALWKSDIFRDSHITGGFIHQKVEEFAWLPRVFAEMSEEWLEKAHFSSWWNVMMHREYDNPVIHDLYWLHEMYHATHMPYVRNIGFSSFCEKMQRNELEASVLSEIEIYLALPELREQSFPYPIYADRFLNREWQDFYWANPSMVRETIRTIRRNLMSDKLVDDMDDVERWVRKFADQNAIFNKVWFERYYMIENHMAEFQTISLSDRREALVSHWEWLEDNMNPMSIPFSEEAEAFALHYWQNKKAFEASLG